MNEYEKNLEIIKKSIDDGLMSGKVFGIKYLREDELERLAVIVLKRIKSYGTIKNGKIKLSVPMTNIACAIGDDVFRGSKDIDSLDEVKRNKMKFTCGFNLLSSLHRDDIVKIAERFGQYMVYVRKHKMMTSLINGVDVKPKYHFHKDAQDRPPIKWLESNHRVCGKLMKYPNPEALKMDSLNTPMVFRVVNKLQFVAVRINKEVLYEAIKSRKDSILTFDDKDLTEDKILSKLTETKNTLIAAFKNRHKERFFMYYKIDFRGRVYPQMAHLNPVASKLARALLMFADEEPIGDFGFDWLKLHIANCLGEDKISPSDRMKYVEDNEESILGLYESGDWQNVDSPFEFLAALLEYKKLKGRGANAMSGLPISFDATNSGLQHLAMLSGCRKSGELCNLTDSDTRGDFYGFVATKVFGKLNTPTEKSIKDYDYIVKKLRQYDDLKDYATTNKMKKRLELIESWEKEFFQSRTYAINKCAEYFWMQFDDYKTRRDIAKAPCMVIWYGAGSKTMADQTLDKFKPESKFAGINYRFCKFLTNKVKRVCLEELRAPSLVQSVFEAMAIRAHENGTDLVVKMPKSGMIVAQYYRYYYKPQVGVYLEKGKKIQPRVILKKKDKLMVKKGALSAQANLTHAFDAQYLMMVVDSADFEMLVCHDSFSCKLANAGELFELCRVKMKEAYSGNALIELLTLNGFDDMIDDDGNIVINHKDTLHFGDLDSSECLGNDWAVS